MALEEVQTAIGQRIKFLMEHYNLSARNFSRALGVPDNNTQNYVSSNPAQPKADYLEKVLHHFQSINPGWLLTGKGEPFLTEEVESGITQTGNFNQAGNSNIQKVKGSKNNLQTNNGDHATITNNIKLDNCQRDLATAKKEIALLTSQLADKERTIQILLKQNS